MRYYRFDHFGLDALELHEGPLPEPGSGEIRLQVAAASLNFRDLMVLRGQYNPRLPLPATPLSDAAGTVSAVGPGVERVAVGDRVVTHFVAQWLDGPFRADYVGSTLGTPGPGVAAEQVVLPQDAVLPIPAGMSFGDAACLPIAALTAWAALRTGRLQPSQTVLTLGTGGVSVFALQLAKAIGARVIITSSSNDKLARAREFGADDTVNYCTEPDWSQRVVALTGGLGADVVVETGGAGTLSSSLRATRAAGTVAMLGALTGLRAEIDIAPVLMKRLTVAGIMVDSRASFEHLLAFLHDHPIQPVIDSRFPFDQLPQALDHMASAHHFGKLLVTT